MRLRIPKTRRPAAPDPAPIDDDDVQLFREAIGPVRRLHAETVAKSALAPRPAPEPVQFHADEARVRDELLSHAIEPGAVEFGDEIQYLKSGQPQRLLQRLRRGEFSVRAEIDLHEMSATVARAAIHGFLDDCRRHGEFCVRIVHGKGLRSREAPVLKQLTDSLLRKRGDVLAFASARPSGGGTGAVIVLLAKD